MSKSTRKTAKSKINVREWMASEDGYAMIELLASKYAKFSFGPTEDMTSELALAILEREAECPKSQSEFAEWLEQLAHETADNLSRKNRNPVATGSLSSECDGEEFQIDVADPHAVDLCAEMDCDVVYCSQLVAHERNRAARIKRALAKLSDDHRQAILDRYFTGKVLSGVAAEEGMCDSSHRMRLLRAKNKLATMIDAEGYAVKQLAA